MATTQPNITSFSGANGGSVTVDGMSAQVENANRGYSLTEPDSNTLRFEVQSGDSWRNDVQSGNTSERSEIEMNQQYSPNTQINVSYDFTLEPGAANTASWMVLGQIHNTVLGGSPPFAVAMYGEHMMIITRGPNGAENDIYRDPNPIQRGHQYQMNIQVDFGSDGTGILKVWRDGSQIVNYTGPLGSGTSNESYYWKEGVYRAPASETVAADYSNLQITTGSTPTQPATPTVTPAVTQASASPGTGTALVGDTVTLSLGFNEAVTVTGTPTLSLNDGGKATYVGGSGTGTLTFKTTVASTDTTTSALAITGVNLPSGASIKDASGVAANLSGAVKTFTGLAIDPPPVSPPISPAVTQATASPGTGTEHVGNTITLSLGFNEAVTVTGTPTLSLNDGGTATYVGGSGTGSLTFKTTVASTNTSTSALAIAGVNLPSGATIKDASGVAANLAGAVKTFSGLQVDPTSSTPTTPTTPSVTRPVLTIADNSLSVAGRGGTIDLGTKVTTTDSNDVVTVNITGLPRYESITDKLDGQTFRGNNITLTAAQVDSGLELQSNYRGGGYPTATLTLTASAKDPSTGAVSTASPQTITVVDPRPTAVATSTSSHHHHHYHHHHIATDHQPAATTTTAPTSPQPIESADHPQATVANAGILASRGFALLQQHFDPATSALATTAPQSIAAADHPVATGMASFASQSFALLNQHLAGHAGQVDAGQIVAAVSHAIGFGQESLLARPQH